jgi:hypothetical protein
MFLRPNRRSKDGKEHTYWSLVEIVRTVDGPRQKTLCYLGAEQFSTGALVEVSEPSCMLTSPVRVNPDEFLSGWRLRTSRNGPIINGNFFEEAVLRQEISGGQDAQGLLEYWADRDDDAGVDRGLCANRHP